MEETIKECQEVADKDQAEEKAAAQDKSKASQGGVVRSRRKGGRRSILEGVVLASGTRRTRRPSAKARSSQ